MKTTLFLKTRNSFSIILFAAALFFVAPFFAPDVGAYEYVEGVDYALQPFSDTSPWNRPIGTWAVYKPVPGLSSLPIGMPSTKWAVGIYIAKDADRTGALYFRSDMWSILNSGQAKNSGNSLDTEDWLRSGAATDPLWPANPYSTNKIGSSGPGPWPSDYHHTTDYYYSRTFKIPAGAVPSPDSDGHIAIFQPNGWVLEAYAAVVCSNGDIVAQIASYTDSAGDGTGWSSGRRASFLPNFAGIVRNGEISSGVINHAMVFNINKSIMKEQALWPAYTWDTNAGYGNCADCLAMGSLLAMPKSVNINSLGLTSKGLILAKAVQDYGLYLVDRGGGGMSIQAQLGATDVTWSNQSNDLNIIIKNLQWVSNNSATTDIQAPTIPTDLTVVVVSSTQINLSWTASTDNVGVVGYKVYRNGSQIGTSTTNSYQNTGLSPSTTYTYTVAAYDAAGNVSAQSTSASATTQAAPDTTAPAAITDLASSNVAENQMTLAWTAPGDDGNIGTAASYDIRYSTSTLSESTWASASQLTGEPTPAIAGSQESYIVTGLSAGTTYYFAIKTSDEVPNVSAISNILSAKTTDNTAPTVSITSPDNGATVQGTITITASATDNVAVLGVQFKVDGANLGSEDTSAPYSISWDTVTVVNGEHTLTAVARDSSGNLTTSANTVVVVNNPAPEPIPTLSVTLTSPLTSSANYNLEATVSGTASGLITYTFYCSRSDAGTNITYPYDYQITTDQTTYTAVNLCKYRKAGTYIAKVIAERQGLVAEARTNITVQPGKRVKSVVLGISQYQTNLTENSLVKTQDNPKVYVIRNGQKMAIPSWQALVASGLDLAGVQIVSAPVLDSTQSVELIKGTSSSKVYLFRNNKLLWIPSAEDFEVNGYQWNNIVIAPDSIITGYGQARLAKTEELNAYYVLNKGLIRHILNPQIFNSYGYDWNEAITLSQNELNMFNTATLIKAQNNDKVYLLENNQKRWIATADVFNKLGFDWTKIQEVNQTEIDIYPEAGVVE